MSLSKAFHSVKHDLLIAKPFGYDYSHDMLGIYLSDRQ